MRSAMGLRGWGYSVAGVMIGVAGAALGAQSDVNSVDAHLKAAEAAAGPEYNGMFHQLCDASLPVPARAGQPAAGRGAGRGAGGGAGRGPQASPDPSTWHAEPVKVFDNLYWFGQTEYSVWAVTTSDGIIVVDTILRLFGGRRSRGRHEEARPRSDEDQIRDRQPRPFGSFRRRALSAGAFRHAGADVPGGLGPAGNHRGAEAEARHGGH